MYKGAPTITDSQPHTLIHAPFILCLHTTHNRQNEGVPDLRLPGPGRSWWVHSLVFYYHKLVIRVVSLQCARPPTMLISTKDQVACVVSVSSTRACVAAAHCVCARRCCCTEPGSVSGSLCSQIVTSSSDQQQLATAAQGPCQQLQHRLQLHKHLSCPSKHAWKHQQLHRQTWQLTHLFA